LFYALKKEGVVNSKEEFWLEMDLQDTETAGAFIPAEVWEKFILKPSNKVEMKPIDYTRRKK